jgi:hypothetical protein
VLKAYDWKAALSKGGLKFVEGGGKPGGPGACSPGKNGAKLKNLDKKILQMIKRYYRIQPWMETVDGKELTIFKRKDLSI